MLKSCDLCDCKCHFTSISRHPQRLKYLPTLGQWKFIKRISVLQDASSTTTSDSEAKRGADPFLEFEADTAKCHALGKCMIFTGSSAACHMGCHIYTAFMSFVVFEHLRKELTRLSVIGRKFIVGGRHVAKSLLSSGFQVNRVALFSFVCIVPTLNDSLCRQSM